MISPTAPFPVPGPECDSAAASSSPAPAREAQNPPSFASHLDQRLTQNAPKRADLPDTRPTQHPKAPADARQKSPQTQNEQSDEENASSSTSAQPTGEETNAAPDAAASKLDAAASHSETSASPSTPSSVFSLAAPVLMTGLAPVITTGLVPALLPHLPNVVPNAPLTATLTALPARANGSAGAALTVPTGSISANSTGNALSASLLPNPGVSMDSRAARITAAPGVDNASQPPTLVPPITGATPAVILPAALAGGASTPMGLPTTTPAPLGVSAAQTPVPTSVSTSQTPVSSGVSVSQTPAPASVVSAVVNSGSNSVSASLLNTVHANTNEANTNEAGTDTASLPDSTAKGQNLNGIMRLLTLGAAKTSSVASLPAASETPVPQTVPGTLPANGDRPIQAQSSSHNRAFVVSQNGFPASTLPAIPSAGAPATTGSTGNSLTADPSVGLNAGVKPGILAAAIQAGSVLPGAHGPNGGALTAANSATAPGSLSGESLLTAALHAPSAETTADGQEQAGTPNQQHGDTATADHEVSNASTSGASGLLPSQHTAGETLSTTQTASTTGGSPADRAHVIDQVTRHLESMRLTEGSGEVRLRLTPHNLGSVQVTIATHQDGIVARLAVETAQVQQAMEGAKEHLRATLEARGLRVSAVEVTVTPTHIGDGNAAFLGQRNGQPFSSSERAEWPSDYGRPSTSRPAAPEAAAAVSLAAPATLLSTARLDYRA